MSNAKIRDTLFFEYVKETLDAEIIENEYGFAIYTVQDKECFIEHMYILPEYRETNCATKLADEICENTKDRATTFAGAIDQDAKEKQKTILVLEGYGMKYSHETPEFIYYKKEI